MIKLNEKEILCLYDILHAITDIDIDVIKGIKDKVWKEVPNDLKIVRTDRS